LNDELQPLKNRLRWLNRGILLLGVLILIGLAAWAVVGLRKPAVGTTTTVIVPTVRPSALASAAARGASAPRQAPSSAQVQKAAAAAIDALAAAGSAPRAAAQPTPAAAGSHPAAVLAAAPASPAAPAQMPAQPQETQMPHAASRPVQPQHEHAAAARKPPQQRAVRLATPAHRVAAARQPAGVVAVCRSAGWYVQVGAFGKPQGIERLAQRLHRAGYTEVCLAPRTVRGLRLFYVGPFRSAAAARAARAPLHTLTGTEGILRKLP